MVQRRVQGYLVLICTSALLSGCASAFSDNTTTAGARPFEVKYDAVNLVELLDPESAARSHVSNWADLKPGQQIDLAFDQYHKATGDLTPERQIISRNHIQERLLGASNQLCHQYQQYMQNVNSSTNFGLGFLTTAAGAAGALVTGGASQILAGTAAAASGTRAEFNQDYFYAVTVSTIFEGINARRAATYEKIKKDRQTASIDEYPIETAIKDAITYHSQCSLIAGVQELGTSVQLAKDPGLDAVNRTLLKINIARDIVERKSTDPADLLGHDSSGPNATSLLGMPDAASAQADQQKDPINVLTASTQAISAASQDLISFLAKLTHWPDLAAAAGHDLKKEIADAVAARAQSAVTQLTSCQAKVLAASSKIAEARIGLSTATTDADRLAGQANVDATILDGQARSSELAPAPAWLKADFNALKVALDAADRSASAAKSPMDVNALNRALTTLTKSSTASKTLACRTVAG